MDLEQLWQLALAEMEVQLSRANFATWLKNSRLVDKNDGTFLVALPNHFAKEWVQNKYHKNLLGAIRNHDPSAKKLEFSVQGVALEEPKQARITTNDFQKFENRMNLEFKVDPSTNLNSRYNLKSFVVGSSNELAYAAANAIIEEIGTKYNPFFVYGGVGLGKTHLIQAIGNEINERYKGKLRAKYVTSEKFTSDVIWGIRNKRMEDVKKKYRDSDVLIIDDIQFIGGKKATEEEFFYTFNALHENSKQIIISSDRPPQSIPTLEERLRSRFEGGLIADIGFPEYEMRMAIIKSKLLDSNRNLSEEIIDLIARKVKKNVREIEGVLNKIIFYREAKKVDLTTKEVEEIIRKSVKDFSQRVTEDQILKAVADFYNVSPEDLSGRVRKKEVVEPRQIAMYLIRDILEMSYPHIGEKMGRDHTTAIHAVDKISQEI
ncbi:MAG: chromosomal replication initiator protein DnaA, partial [Candidatus Liptonbacteria bacterium]|nr:chromosomal replication initiator protein DnaA [Candidatus Liptonbacteria bacterium]